MNDLKDTVLLHLSHNDMDGFGCQVMTTGLETIRTEYFNTNYGEEADKSIKDIISLANETSIKNKVLVLITDFSLNVEQCEKLESIISNNIEILVIDHHPVDDEYILNLDWYHLTIGKSATLLTFKYFETLNRNKYPLLARTISAYDVFDKTYKEQFRIGSYINTIVYSIISNIGYSDEFSRNVIRKSLIGLNNILSINSNSSMAELIYRLETETPMLLNDVYGCDDDKFLSERIVSIITEQQLINTDNRYTYKDYGVLISKGMNQPSIVANEILEKDNSIQLVIIANPKKLSVSIRSIGTDGFNCTELARKYGGGGHYNASGFKFDNPDNKTLDELLEDAGFVKIKF